VVFCISTQMMNFHQPRQHDCWIQQTYELLSIYPLQYSYWLLANNTQFQTVKTVTCQEAYCIIWIVCRRRVRMELSQLHVLLSAHMGKLVIAPFDPLKSTEKFLQSSQILPPFGAEKLTSFQPHEALPLTPWPGWGLCLQTLLQACNPHLSSGTLN